MSIQTALYPLHLDLGGKMTEFADHLLPVQYGKGIIHEHLHCRSRAGFFDISHMGQFLISGAGAAAGLERLTPSDISGLKPGQMKYTVLTNEAGGIIDDIIVTRTVSGLAVVVNAACKAKDFGYLKQQLPAGYEVVELEGQSLLALQGPASAKVITQFCPSAGELAFMQSCEAFIHNMPCRISRCGYTGEDGFEISVQNNNAEALARLLLADEDVEPVGLGARDTLRLEAGLCLYGHELDGTTTPVEAGLGWLIKKGHSGFPGAEIILGQKQTGPERERIGLIAEGRQPVRADCAVHDEEGRLAGRITSGGFSPSLGKPVAMAYIDRDQAVAGKQLHARLRDKIISLTLTGLPFIPHRYAGKTS